METAERERVQALLEEAANRKAVILEARQQPKSAEVEKALAERYGAMGLQERAYTILVDLGIVSVTPVPGSKDYDASLDDEIAPENVFLP